MTRKTEIADAELPRQNQSANSDGADIQFAAIFREEPRLYVQIAQGDGEEGRNAVKLGIQGYMVMVPRGVKVALPKSYVDLLADLTVGESTSDGNDRWDRPRFSYSVMGVAPSRPAA